MAIADISGQTFGLPGTTGYGGASFIGKSQAELAAEKAGFQPAQGQPVLPDINEDIFQMEGISNDYVNNYATLRSFVEMMNQQGVDVTKPDFTQPDGGEAFKTYKKLEGYLLNTAGRLKNELASRKTYETLLAQDRIRLAPGFDQRTQFMSETPQDQMYYSTELLPEVDAANKKLNEILYSGGDAKRYEATVREPLKKELQRMISQTTSPAQKARLQANIDALARPTWQTDKTLEQIAQRRVGKGATTEGVAQARKVISIVKGYLPESNYTVEQVDGQTAAVNRELSGMNYGQYDQKTKTGSKETVKMVPRVIDKIVHLPDERTLMYFKNTDSGEQIPPEDISAASGDTILGLLKQSNPKSMGKLPIYDLTPEGSYSEPDVYDTPETYKTVQEYGEQLMGKIRGADTSVKAAKQAIKADLVNLPVVTGKIWTSDADLAANAVVITIGNVPYKIARTEKGYYSIDDKNNASEPMTLDELMSELEADGAIDAYKTQQYIPNVQNSSSGTSSTWGVKTGGSSSAWGTEKR